MSGDKPSNDPQHDEPVEGTIVDSDDETVETLDASGNQLSIEALALELEASQQKAQENWDKAVRIQAEMENLRRRTEKDVQSAHLFGLEKFAKELLPVVDSLELGIAAATGSGEEITKLREGSELTLKQLDAALQRFNITPVDPTGQPFNPEQHQAMSMQPDAEAAPNTVLKVFQKGYLLNDRLLRPALVVVAQAAPSTKIDEQA